MNWAHMAHKILTSRGGFRVHISSSSIGIITAQHHQHQHMDRAQVMSQNSRPILPLSYSWKTASPTKVIFTQNDNKAQGTSSHLRLMIQAHESLWGNFGSHGLEGQELCLVKL